MPNHILGLTGAHLVAARASLFAGQRQIGRALTAPRPTELSRSAILSSVISAGDLIQPVEIDEAVDIHADGLSDFESLKRLEISSMDDQLVAPPNAPGQDLFIITGRSDRIRCKAVAEDVHFVLPDADGELTCFGGAIEVSIASQERPPQFGDAGALVVTEEGGLVGILIGGNEDTHFVSPLYETLYQKNYEFLNRDWLSTFLEVRTKRRLLSETEQEPVSVASEASERLPPHSDPGPDDYLRLDESEAAEFLGERQDDAEHAA